MMITIFKFAGLPFMKPLHRSAAELLKAVYGEG